MFVQNVLRIFVPAIYNTKTNMDKEELRSLPDSIILEENLTKSRASWFAILGRAQAAYERLLADKDVSNDLPAFDKLNEKWLREFINEKIAEVMKSPYPHNSRMEAVAEWRTLENDLLKDIEEIEQLKNIDSAAKVEVKGCHITISNMEELLRQKSVFVVPDEFKQFFNVAVKCVKQIEELEELQVKWGIKPPINVSSAAFHLVCNPVEFVKFCRGQKNQLDYESRLNKPSELSLQLKAQREERKRKEDARRKLKTT